MRQRVAAGPPALEQALEPSPVQVAVVQVGQSLHRTCRRNCCPALAERHSLGRVARQPGVRQPVQPQARLAPTPHRSCHRMLHPPVPARHTQSTWWQ